jgi:hypothetical protein
MLSRHEQKADLRCLMPPALLLKYSGLVKGQKGSFSGAGDSCSPDAELGETARGQLAGFPSTLPSAAKGER